MKMLLIAASFLLISACAAERPATQLSDQDIQEIAKKLARVNAAVVSANEPSGSTDKLTPAKWAGVIYVPAEKKVRESEEVPAPVWLPVDSAAVRELKNKDLVTNPPSQEEWVKIFKEVKMAPLAKSIEAMGYELQPSKAIPGSSIHYYSIPTEAIVGSELVPGSAEQGVGESQVVAFLVQKLTALRDSFRTGPVRLTGFTVTLGLAPQVTATFIIVSE